MLPTDHLPAFLLTVYVLILIPGAERPVRGQPRQWRSDAALRCQGAGIADSSPG